MMIGKSGSGKSELGLQLIEFGARLVADDQTCLTRKEHIIEVSCPEPIRDMIELRGLGILRVPAIPAAQLAVIVDLDAAETARLPERRIIEVHGLYFRYLRNCASSAFAAGLKHYVLSGEWQNEED